MLGWWFFTLVVGTGGGPDAGAGQSPRGEYEVKAAFVYNFLKFVELPPQAVADADRIRICVVGEIPMSAPFDDLDNQDLMGKRLAVTHLETLADARECHVLFIASSEEQRLPMILEALKGAGTLTIGDTEGFAQKGVIINFYLEKKRVRFEINAEAARRNGLKISSKLLKLAGAVYGPTPAGD